MNIFRRRQKSRLNKKRVKDIKRGRSRGRSKTWKSKRKNVRVEKRQKYKKKS